MNDQSHKLIESLSKKLKCRSLKLCTAESCTGGLVSTLCTDLAGSSEWFNGAVVSYDNSVKTGLLHVSPDILKEYGAVSPECAEAMARGALKACNAQCAISTTGIAGPGGGSESKPVGTVVIGLALPVNLAGKRPNGNQPAAGPDRPAQDKAIPQEKRPEEPWVYSTILRLQGDRAAVRLQAAQEALRLMDEKLPD